MAKQEFSVTIWGKRKSGGTATFDVEVTIDDAALNGSGSRDNNEVMKSIVMSQRPDVMSSHGTMEEIKVMGFTKRD